MKIVKRRGSRLLLFLLFTVGGFLAWGHGKSHDVRYWGAILLVIGLVGLGLTVARPRR